MLKVTFSMETSMQVRLVLSYGNEKVERGKSVINDLPLLRFLCDYGNQKDVTKMD